MVFTVTEDDPSQPQFSSLPTPKYVITRQSLPPVPQLDEWIQQQVDRRKPGWSPAARLFNSFHTLLNILCNTISDVTTVRLNPVLLDFIITNCYCWFGARKNSRRLPCRSRIFMNVGETFFRLIVHSFKRQHHIFLELLEFSLHWSLSKVLKTARSRSSQSLTILSKSPRGLPRSANWVSGPEFGHWSYCIAISWGVTCTCLGEQILRCSVSRSLLQVKT
jgi:hypothetical protein